MVERPNSTWGVSLRPQEGCNTGGKFLPLNHIVIWISTNVLIKEKQELSGYELTLAKSNGKLQNLKQRFNYVQRVNSGIEFVAN
jgi:hypothetical protein